MKALLADKMPLEVVIGQDFLRLTLSSQFNRCPIGRKIRQENNVEAIFILS